jgi:hypothetical protein
LGKDSPNLVTLLFIPGGEIFSAASVF